MRNKKVKNVPNSSEQEDEMSKLRRTIETQRLKAELSSKLPAQGSPFPFSENGLNNSEGTSEPENVYPVFVPPDQDHWSTGASTISGPTLPISAGSTLTRSSADNISPESSINKRVSSGSLSSVSSHISGSSSSTSSGSSGPEIEAAMKQTKKKRWLPLKSAFSKGSKSQSSSQPDLLDSEDSGCPLSPTVSRRNLHTTGSVGSTAESEAIQELLQVVQEKEKKLTDIRLEALTSQHQIHQLREQITQMQNEMQLLRLENERLQAEVDSSRSNSTAEERSHSPAHASSKVLSRTSSSGLISTSTKALNFRTGQSRSLSCNQSPVSSPLHRPTYTTEPPTGFPKSFSAIDCRNLQGTLSPDSEGSQVRFVVTSSSTMLPGKRSIMVGSLPVPRRATWDELDRMAETILVEYCRVIDNEANLSLSAASIESYQVGDLSREIGGKTPDLLPCAYIVGDVDTVELKLKDASRGYTDQMAFDMLMSRDTLECYISLLLQHGRIILEGPSGAGKGTFAMSMSEYLVARLRTEGGNTMVTVMDAQDDGEEKLQKYIMELTSRSKTVESPSVPAVLVVKNLHLLSSMATTLDYLLSICGSEGRTPYIIGTTQPIRKETQELHYGFKVISCACESPHVQRYLTRALRRSLVDHVLTSSSINARENGKLSSIVLWLPLCWQHVNRFLESIGAQSSCIGPKMFLKAPISVTASCNWFVNLWNRTVIPHLSSAVSNHSGNNTWEDPSKWVINSFPWDSCETGVNPMKQINRLESGSRELPTYPPSLDSPDGDYEDLPLPPPPVPVRSPTNNFRTPCATSSPIKGVQNRTTLNTNGHVNQIGSYASTDVWQKHGGSSTLQRTNSRTLTSAKHFNTVGAKPQKYMRSDSAGSGEDELKSMLAQLKQAALSVGDDCNSKNQY